MNKNPVTPPPQTPIIMERRIGTTTYRIRVYPSTTSKETMNDKIKRLIRNEVELSEIA